MKKHRYLRSIEDKSYKASFELALLLKDHFDFIIKQYDDDDRYADILTYENPHGQKMRFERRKVAIVFDYIHIWIRYNGSYIWNGYEINHYFLVQLHYLSSLNNRAGEDFIDELKYITGFNQSYQDWVSEQLA